jgi:hypothetical protein
MPVISRELYCSSNGDRWYLEREPRSERVFVRHQPNAASGGDAALIELAEFLARNHGPEQQELLRLIGSLVASAPPVDSLRVDRGSQASSGTG